MIYGRRKPHPQSSEHNPKKGPADSRPPGRRVPAWDSGTQQDHAGGRPSAAAHQIDTGRQRPALGVLRVPLGVPARGATGEGHTRHLAARDIEDEGLVAGAARKGELLGALLEPLRSLRPVGDVRRRGMMAGVELVRDAATREAFAPEERAGWRVCEEARRRGVLLRPLGNVVVVMPPLGAPDAVLGEIVSVLAASIRAALPVEKR